MCECLQEAKQFLRGLAVLMLIFVLCGGLPAAAAKGAEASPRMLVPVGHTVGIKLFSQGIVVVKPPESGTPAEACGLQSGDVILRCGEEQITSTEQFQTLLQASGGVSTPLQVRRSGSQMTLEVEAAPNDEGVYCIGAWVRDSMAGIGTVTYYDPETKRFGALGHGITDVDTAVLMPFSRGEVLPSTVKAVKKGVCGAAGELRGKFDLTQELGELYANTEAGVFGTLAQDADWLSGEALPVGTAAPGKAEILANVAGDTVCRYEIEVVKTASGHDGRELTLKVTDPELLQCTGGVVQGMSGSPILQNGKIVGAVTHVLLNDPCKGYGISIETMLDAAG